MLDTFGPRIGPVRSAATRCIIYGDEEAGRAVSEATAETTDGCVGVLVEGDVKPEPEAEGQPKKTSACTPSYERTWIADAEFLDGTSPFSIN